MRFFIIVGTVVPTVLYGMPPFFLIAKLRIYTVMHCKANVETKTTARTSVHAQYSVDTLITMATTSTATASYHIHLRAPSVLHPSSLPPFLLRGLCIRKTKYRIKKGDIDEMELDRLTTCLQGVSLTDFPPRSQRRAQHSQHRYANASPASHQTYVTTDEDSDSHHGTHGQIASDAESPCESRHPDTMRITRPRSTNPHSAVFGLADRPSTSHHSPKSRADSHQPSQLNTQTSHSSEIRRDGPRTYGLADEVSTVCFLTALSLLAFCLAYGDLVPPHQQPACKLLCLAVALAALLAHAYAIWALCMLAVYPSSRKPCLINSRSSLQCDFPTLSFWKLMQVRCLPLRVFLWSAMFAVRLACFCICAFLILFVFAECGFVDCFSSFSAFWPAWPRRGSCDVQTSHDGPFVPAVVMDRLLRMCANERFQQRFVL